MTDGNKLTTITDAHQTFFQRCDWKMHKSRHSSLRNVAGSDYISLATMLQYSSRFITEYNEKKQKARTKLRFLRKLIHPFIRGIKTWAGNPCHINLRADVLAHFNRQPHERKITFLSVSDYHKHCDCLETYYYVSDGRAEYLLGMVDIDVHKGRGSTAGAQRLVEKIKERFPDFAYEPSTNGKGIHGYILIKIDYRGWENAWSHLERWLKDLAAPFVENGDIALMELKGKPPRFHYEDGKLVHINMGTLAKLPRIDISGTTVLTTDQVLALTIAEPQKTQKVKLRLVTAERSGLIPAYNECTGLKTYRSQAYTAMGYLEKVKNRKVTWAHAAVLLGILDWCRKYPNPDGSIPVNRIKAIWNDLYQSGAIEVSHHSTVVAALLRAFTACGFLDWQDVRYYYDGDGQTEGARKFSLVEEKPVLRVVEEREEDTSCNPPLFFFDLPTIAIPVTKEVYWANTG